MRFGVLGPVTVWDATGRALDVPGVKVRAALAVLLVHRGQVVSADRLIAALWGDDAPQNAPTVLRSKVSQLRRVLTEAGFDARAVLDWRPPGYVLDVPADLVDAERFAATGDLELWRGEAYGEFRDHRFARAAVAELDELRLAATETHARERVEVDAAAVAGELAALAWRHPLRESLHAVWMRALARAGRPSEALAVHAALAARLRDAFGTDPGPEVAAVHVELLRPAEPVAPAPVAPLPDPVAELVGRAEPLRELRKLLAAHRLVTVTGPGGVGKTRLALEAAHGTDETDGAAFVDLSGLPAGTDAAAVTAAVAAQLGVRDDPASGASRNLGARLDERLGSWLMERRMLLVLDNCEHLTAAARALVRRLLSWSKGLRVVATSREALRLPEEHLLALDSLPAPPAGTPFAVFDLERYSAVKLLVDRAAAAGARIGDTPDEMRSAAAIARRLDGLPLALELAAARLPAFGLDALERRLDDRFRLLRTAPGGVPERHATLEAVIAWSWDQLPEPERLLLARMAIAPGGLTLDAAEACCGGDGVDVLVALPRLVEQSLLTVAHTPDGPRYRMLESVAAFARDRLAESGGTAKAADRHAAHFLALAADLDPELRGSGQRRALDVLRSEADNLRAALRHHSGVEAADRLVWFWILTGRLTEAERELSRLIATAAPSPERTRAETWASALRMRLDPKRIAPMPTVVESRADWFLLLTHLAARTPIAEPPRSHGDPWLEAALEFTRALRAWNLGDLETAALAAARSRDAFDDLGDAWGALQTLDLLSRAADARGGDGATLDAEALRVAEDLGLTSDLSRILSRLGRRALRERDFDTAAAHYRRARDLAAEQCDAMVYDEAEAGLRAVSERNPLPPEVDFKPPACAADPGLGPVGA
ncbi:BTAD domain-containing putative transcriptional regulator [Glycomyces sp. NPDC046736]|uniref:BTAD domain-containing putative transcriptional regulator n=1 Tax=Glycomyces sp. NPDC046736 TaxID=3155615 RepID=UPI0033DADF8A